MLDQIATPPMPQAAPAYESPFTVKVRYPYVPYPYEDFGGPYDQWDIAYAVAVSAGREHPKATITIYERLGREVLSREPRDQGCKDATHYDASALTQTETPYRGTLPEVLRRLAAEIEAHDAAVKQRSTDVDRWPYSVHNTEVRVRIGTVSDQWKVRRRFHESTPKPLEDSTLAYRREHPGWCYE